jgi:phosphoserine phosphatase
MKKLAVIDVDKTFLKIDSSFYFIRSYKRLDLYFWGLLRKMNIISRAEFASKIVRIAQKVLNKKELTDYIKTLKREVDPQILKKIEKLKDEGVDVIVISASPNVFVKALCEVYRIKGFGSYFNSEGEFVYLYGEKKLEFLLTSYPREKYLYYLAVSDSRSDDHLLKNFMKSYYYKNKKFIKCSK